MTADRPSNAADEPPYAWVVVWATFTSLAVIFGVAHSFAAFFESMATEFQARDAPMCRWCSGLSGLVYFTLGAGAGMLADRVGPRRVSVAGMLCIAGGLLASSPATSMTMWRSRLWRRRRAWARASAPRSPRACSRGSACRRGPAAGLASAGIGAGTLLVPLLAAWAIALVQWRQAMVDGAGRAGAGAGRRLAHAAERTGGAGRPRAVAASACARPLRRPFAWMYAMAVLACRPCSSRSPTCRRAARDRHRRCPGGGLGA